MSNGAPDSCVQLIPQRTTRCAAKLQSDAMTTSARYHLARTSSSVSTSILALGGASLGM